MLAQGIAIVALLAATAACGPAPGPAPRSEYVSSADGTRLAVDAYVPAASTPGATLEAGASTRRWPAVLRITRRWRDFDLQPRPGIGAPRAFEVATFTAAGYALVLADARGTGASFGARIGPPGLADADDVLSLLDWIVAQPWSDGRVAVWGEGDDAAFAELAAIGGHPAVRAAVLRFGELDLYAQLAHPGGVPNGRLLAALERETRLLDAGDACAFAESDVKCDEVDVLFRGPRPVGGDRAALAAAIAEHGDGQARWLAAAGDVLARDAPLAPPSLSAGAGSDSGAAPWPPTLGDASPLAWLDALARGDVPIQAWAGWLDGGTADAALARFGARRWHHEVIIVPLGHRGLASADPISAIAGPPEPSVQSQFRRMITFLDAHVRGDAGESPNYESPIDLVAAGGERLNVDRWPPRGAEVLRWYPSADGSLRLDAPGPASAQVTRRLAVEPGGGAAGRWLGRVSDAFGYAGPDASDASVAAFTSEPLPGPGIIAGHPVVTVTLAIDRRDGVVHAYLEVLDPGGEGRLISDGGLALVHRTLGPTAPFDRFPARHPFTLAARQPARPGTAVEATIRLWPIAASVQQGQRVRLSLVGGALSGGSPAAQGGTDTMTLTLDEGAVLSLPIVALPTGAPAAR